MLTQVVMENLIDFLLELACREVIGATPEVLNHYALVKAQTPAYIRQTQVRVILAPLAERLLTHFGQHGLISQLKRMIETARHTEPAIPGYLVGNLLNLLVYLRIDIRGPDLANLYVWQADLRDADLTDVNLQNADLRGSVLADTFTDKDYPPRSGVNGSLNGGHAATRRYVGMNITGV